MRERKATRNGRRRRLSPDQRAEREAAIIEDIKGGVLSYREIALKHGVSLPTVNNKARKAGISRGRRKGARIIVAAPPRKTARKAGRKAARRGRPRRAAVVQLAPEAPMRAARRGRPGRRPRGRPRGIARSQAGFAEEFGALLLKHHPNILYSKYEQLMRMVKQEVR